MTTRLQDLPPFTGHVPPGEERPLGGYVATMSIWATLTAAFVAWFKNSGRELPDRVEPYDIALITMATHKSSRLITKEKVLEPLRAPFTEFEGKADIPAELSESARGSGLRHSIGELLTCPYCLSVWIATAFVCGMAVAPRLTRQVGVVFTAIFGSDLLQQGYARLAR